MRLRSALLGFLAVNATALPAHAAPATAEKAQGIKAALQRYLGAGAAGAEPVSVTPDGDSYTIAIDVKATLHALQAFGVTVAPMTYTLTATPGDDGTWRVRKDGEPQLSASYGEQTYSVVVNGLKSASVFDPRIPAFTSSTTSYDSSSIATQDGKGTTQTRQQRGGKQDVTATVVSDGVVDMHLAQTNSGFTQDVTVDKPATATLGLAVGTMSIKSGPTATAASVDSLHIRAIADLWAFLVAHPDRADLQASQPQLRDLLRAALPLFKHWSQDVSATEIAVQSPIGPIGVEAFSLHLDLDGLVPDGHVATDAKIEGLSIPAGVAPPWTAGLLPVAAEIKQTFSGYRLDTAAAEAINSFDLGNKDPFPHDAAERITAMIGPLDHMLLTLAPSHIASKLLDLKFEGMVRFAQPMPDVHMTLHASGLDAVIQDIQAKGGKDPRAPQLTAVLVMAKGYGRAEPDGSLTWVIDKNGAGAVTVNGVALPIGLGK